ncbi:MAG: hypothetical protein WC364_14795 [Eubacteriales bacterium]
MEFTADNAKMALAQNKDFEQAEVVIEGGNAQVIVKPETFWDDTDLVKMAGEAAISAGDILFKNPNLAQLKVITSAVMTDQYGNEKTESAAYLIIKRETAGKINWTGLAERHISDPGNIYRVVDDFYVHPGVLKNVKTTEIKF